MTQSFAHLCKLCLEPFSGFCQVRQCPMLGGTLSGTVAAPAIHPDATRAVGGVGAASPDSTRAVGAAAPVVPGGDPDATRLPQAHERALPTATHHAPEPAPRAVEPGPRLPERAAPPSSATRPLAALPQSEDDGLSTRYVSPPPRSGKPPHEEP